MMKHQPQCHLPPPPKQVISAKTTGMAAIGIAVLAALVHPLASVVPLLFYVILCFTAPLLPGFSFFLPIISRGPSHKQAVALTFDDGPNPASTTPLLDLLDRHGVRATFFVNGHRAAQFPQLIRQMTTGGHTIGNHTYTHDNLIMFKSTQALHSEIERTQHALQALSVHPLTFRPPVGVTSPRLGPVLKQMGMYTVNFSCRAGDRGNRRIHDLSDRILGKLRSGDIIMLHDIPPRKSQTPEAWLRQVDRLLTGIRKRDLRIVPLSDLIDRPVMAEDIKKDAVSEDNCAEPRSAS